MSLCAFICHHTNCNFFWLCFPDEWESDEDDDEGEWMDVYHSSDEQDSEVQSMDGFFVLLSLFVNSVQFNSLISLCRTFTYILYGKVMKIIEI